MKEIKLTRGKTTLVDDEDFEFLNQWKWQAHGCRGILYARRRQKNNDGSHSVIHMHKEVMKVSGTNTIIDHKDRNSLNNQKANLRTCNTSQNTANSRKRLGCTSKHRGVAKYRDGKWRAYAAKNGKMIHLGYFEDESDAAKKYNEVALKLHGEFANLNII